MARRFTADRESALLTMARCECEHASHERGCPGSRDWEHSTVYGRYLVCHECHSRGHATEAQSFTQDEQRAAFEGDYDRAQRKLAAHRESERLRRCGPDEPSNAVND